MSNPKTRPQSDCHAPRVPALPFAVFDEHGHGADDRVRDYAAQLVAAERERIINALPAGHSVDPQWVADIVRWPQQA